MELEHVEAAMVEVLRAVSALRLDDVVTVEMALRAGWLTDNERKRLAPLADAFFKLGQS